MNPLQLIMIAVEGISLLTNNPALGGGSNLKLQEASKLLAFLGELLARGEEGYEDLKEFALSVKEMADENRGPTPNEWADIKARSDAAHDVIQEVRRRAEAEDKAEEEEEQRLKDEAEAEERRLKEEALKNDIARLSGQDLLAAAESLRINVEGMGREAVEALVLEAKLAE